MNKVHTAITKHKSKFDNDNYEQMQALNAISNNDNVFITGAGGTGKSFFIALLSKIFFSEKITFRIVTPTGISAINLNESLTSNGCPALASTYHSLYGFMPNREDRRLHSSIKTVIKELDVLIIDEVGMIDSLSFDVMSFKHTYPQKETSGLKNRISGGLFDKTSLFDKFFGNTQVIMFGDLFQLPPVVKEDLGQYGYDSEYMFDSQAYKLGEFETISFYKNYRVATFADEANKRKSEILKKLLGDVRYGCLSKQSKQALSNLNKKRVINEEAKLIDKLVNDDFVLLSPYNAECDRINRMVKSSVNTRALTTKTVISHKLLKQMSKYTDTQKNNFLNKRFGLPFKKVFKLHQKVLITSNDKRKGYYNGDLGFISKVHTYQGEVESIEVTVNRLGGAETYTINKKLYTKPTVMEAEKLRKRVTYSSPSSTDVDKQIKTIVSTWVEAFPLKDGYAITNHRAQSKTFKKTIINPNGFGNSMFYVALSRNTNLDGILLTDFVKPLHIRVDPYICKYYLENELVEEYMIEPIKDKIKILGDVA